VEKRKSGETQGFRVKKGKRQSPENPRDQKNKVDPIWSGGKKRKGAKKGGILASNDLPKSSLSIIASLFFFWFLWFSFWPGPLFFVFVTRV
jgi:hypothetical protein